MSFVPTNFSMEGYPLLEISQAYGIIKKSTLKLQAPGRMQDESIEMR